MPSTTTDPIGLAMKAPCRVASAVNVTRNGLQTIDGVSVVAGDRVLLMNQSDADENGIYVADTSEWGRACDFDGARDAVQGTLVHVVSGSVNGNKFYQLTTANPVIGTSNLTFAESILSPVETILDGDNTFSGDNTFPGGNDFSGSNSHSGAETFTGPVALNGAVSGTGIASYLRNNRVVASVRDYGAVGNGVTDDAAAITAAVAAVVARGGGIVYLPTGNYRVNSTIAVDASVGVHLMGEHPIATAITTIADVTLVTLDGTGRHTVENLQLLGFGIVGGNGVACSSTSHALHVKSTCVDAYLHRLLIAGGYYGVKNDGTDTVSDNIIIYNVYGGALFYNTGGAPWFRRCKLDNPWPVSIPSNVSSISARANSTGYNVGDVRSLSGYYIQCATAGTSGGSPPTLQNFGTPITDGTAVWYLACGTSCSSLELTTGSSEAHIAQCDFSGAFHRGIYINNNLSGTAPWVIEIAGSCVSQSIAASVDCVAGSTLLLSGNELFAPITVEGALVLRSAWTGDASVVNNIFAGATGRTGVAIQGGVNAVIADNTICGWATGISVDAGVTKFIISGNAIGSSARWGTNVNSIIVGAGASDYYNIVNNIVRGATSAGVTDNGSGSNKTVSGNV